MEHAVLIPDRAAEAPSAVRATAPHTGSLSRRMLLIAVLAIVAAAVIRIGRKVLKNEVMWTLAALAFVAIFFCGAPFPLIIGAAARVASWIAPAVRRSRLADVLAPVLDDAARRLRAPA